MWPENASLPWYIVFTGWSSAGSNICCLEVFFKYKEKSTPLSAPFTTILPFGHCRIVWLLNSRICICTTQRTIWSPIMATTGMSQTAEMYRVYWHIADTVEVTDHTRNEPNVPSGCYIAPPDEWRQGVVKARKLFMKYCHRWCLILKCVCERNLSCWHVSTAGEGSQNRICPACRNKDQARIQETVNPVRDKCLQSPRYVHVECNEDVTLNNTQVYKCVLIMYVQFITFQNLIDLLKGST